MRPPAGRSAGRPRSALARATAAPRRCLVAGLVAVLAATMVLVVDVGPALACSCAPPPPPSEALDEADAVFAGAVVDTRLEGREVDGERVASIEVVKVYAGDVTEVVEVSTEATGAMCGYGFEVGTDELIYASQEDDGTYRTHLCSRTTSLERAAEDLEALGEGTAPREGEQIREAGSLWRSSDGLLLAMATGIVLAMMLGVVLLRRRGS